MAMCDPTTGLFTGFPLNLSVKLRQYEVHAQKAMKVFFNICKKYIFSHLIPLIGWVLAGGRCDPLLDRCEDLRPAPLTSAPPH